MNKAIIIGNLTKDIELRKTNSNKSVAQFSVAVNDGYGENKTTEFIECTAWEKTAELLQKYCSKGMKIMVDGSIKTDVYEKNEQKIYKTYILVRNVEFLSRPESRNESVVETFEEKKGEMNGQIVIESDELPFY